MNQHSIYQELHKGFLKPDPWGFNSSKYDQERLRKMLEIVKHIPHGSILEIGCAEGHFTKMLATICDDITSIDISTTAIDRAMQRAPQAKYITIGIEDFIPDTKYDVVVCSEMLYYIIDRNRITNKIQTLGKYLLTSHYLKQWNNIKTELSLWHLKSIKRAIHFSITERKICMISLWDLMPIG